MVFTQLHKMELTKRICIFGLVLINLYCVYSSEIPCNGPSCDKSEVASLPGHWPASYCKITNVMFNTGSKTLKINGEPNQLDKCFKTRDIWKFDSQPAYQELNDIVCDQVFTRGHFFTTYYFHGSNYFHLHFDTLIPLYVALQQNPLKPPYTSKDITLLPAVETARGEGIDWDTDAFMDYDSYWMQMLMMVSKSHRFLPLDRKLTSINKTVCFKEAYFGTPKINFSDPSVLHSYTAFVRKALGIKAVNPDRQSKPKVGLIHREGRRKILNENQLVDSVKTFASVETVDFSGMSVKEQIQKVQEYNVLIGMNGAGLINALYMPKTSVAVQLVPYKAELNVDEFANFLKTRGPYLEWHNSHPELNHSAPEDLFRNGADTVVNVDEFVEVVRRALSEYKEQQTLDFRSTQDLR